MKLFVYGPSQPGKSWSSPYRRFQRMEKYEKEETRNMKGAAIGGAGSIIITYFLLGIESDWWKLSILFLPFFLTIYMIANSARNRIREERNKLKNELKSVGGKG